MEHKQNRIDEFVYKANPNEWLEVSDELFNSIELIIKNDDVHFLKTDTWDYKPIFKKHSSRSIFLLAGFCIENLIKGNLIFDNPNLINTGTLHNSLKSHNLTKLINELNNLSLTNIEYEWISKISESIPDWGRYPAPLNHYNIKEEVIFNDEMFKNLCCIREKLRIMLIGKLKQGWNSGLENDRLNIKIENIVD